MAAHGSRPLEWQDDALAEPLLTKSEVDEPGPLSPEHALRRRLPVTRGILLPGLLLAILAPLYFHLRPRTTPPPSPKRIWLRAVEDNHSGLGSVVGQTRLAAALARAVDATLVVPHDPTGHGYSAADFINPDVPTLLDPTSVCVLSGRLTRNQTANLPHDARVFCDTGSLSKELERLKECTIIIDDRPWEYRRDFADCTSGWWDDIIQVPSPRGGFAGKAKTTVAVHVRWGDTRSRIGFDSPTKNATLRSIPLSVADPIVQKLASCRDLDVHVYMEDGAKDLFPLSHPYTLHDGKGVLPLDELREIANADIRLTATGGFASLIHWSARHGLSIVPVDPNGVAPYYTRSERIKVVYQGNVIAGQLSCDDLEAALTL
ncbi:proteophosphoglycan 5 [Rhodotorula toruloides]|uniref:Proteophosphoglycan 5 n=1 Tax=Rhodotorula toruloides TaxID=5286 RepID=A0A511KKW4_RHOTO|nr:proteophosphoglycan 5 [Rhodotorula toruloides]